jgi:hypothetical protein
MAERKILAELIEGVEATKKHREGKLTLRSYRVEVTPPRTKNVPPFAKIKTANGLAAPLSAKPLGCATRHLRFI